MPAETSSRNQSNHINRHNPNSRGPGRPRPGGRAKLGRSLVQERRFQAETLYGEVTQRQFGDLDLLVLPTDALRAKAALFDLGYKPSIELAPEIENAYIKTGYEYSFSTADASNLLELQWRILPRFYSIDFDMADLFERAHDIDPGTEQMDDGRPRPSLCVTSAMQEFASCNAPQRPLKN